MFHYPYFDLYRKQVVKQADLVMALFYAGEYFTPGREGSRLRVLRAADRPRLIAVGVHPGRRGGRGGSRGARLRLLRRSGPDRPGRPRAQHPRRGPHRLARRILHRGDRRLRRSARHAARRSASCPASRRRSPALRSTSALAKTTRLRVEVEPTQATYTLLTGETLDIHHHGEPITLTTGQPVQRPIPPAHQLHPPTQPPGREPLRRRRQQRKDRRHVHQG